MQLTAAQQRIETQAKEMFKHWPVSDVEVRGIKIYTGPDRVLSIVMASDIPSNKDIIIKNMGHLGLQLIDSYHDERAHKITLAFWSEALA